MRIILFGATGMVGQGVLRECLLDPGVERVLAVVRTPTEQRHEKLREFVVGTSSISRPSRASWRATTRASSAWESRRRA